MDIADEIQAREEKMNNMYQGNNAVQESESEESDKEVLTRIGTDVFQDCTSLALTSLPDGLTRIGTTKTENGEYKTVFVNEKGELVLKDEVKP